jgi:hypothetical protein
MPEMKQRNKAVSRVGIILFALAVLALLLLACDDGNSGRLVSKQQSTCTRSEFVTSIDVGDITIPVYEDEQYDCWKFTLLVNEDSGEEAKYITIEVPQRKYEAYQVGDYYP